MSNENRQNIHNQVVRSSANAPQKGLAIASLVVGIISIPTLGLLFVGGITGIVLGVVAMSKAKKHPTQYAGKGLAIAGILTSSLSLLIPILVVIMLFMASISIPNLLKAAEAARETAALHEVKAIGEAQIKYSIEKGGGKFTDLRTLAAQGFVDPALSSGQKNGYLFTSEPISVQGLPPMFDTTARPVGVGNRSFYSNETLVIYEAKGGEPPRATYQDRVPRKGIRVSP